MSHFYIVHCTGLLYRFMYNIHVFKRNAMKFDRHVPEKYVYECMSSHLLLWYCK